ncbi:MAG: hypothetical protein HOP19_11495 [Acidobacteria bacterium]|nr:hypothetical protein [Acidobacteriota bacterium]
MRQTISLRQSVFNQIAEAAREERISPSRLIAQAIEDFLQRRQNRRDAQRLDEAYADGPTEEEREWLRFAWESHCRIFQATGNEW